MAPYDWLDLLIELGAAIAVIAGWLRFVRPRWRRIRRDLVSARDAVIGRDAIIDPASGEQVAPALPGIGARMATVEDAQASTSVALDRLAQVVATLAERQAADAALSSKVDALEAHVADCTSRAAGLDARVGRLEAAAVERITATAAVAAATLTAKNGDTPA